MARNRWTLHVRNENFIFLDLYSLKENIGRLNFEHGRKDERIISDRE
jgi:hypothetical protein